MKNKFFTAVLFLTVALCLPLSAEISNDKITFQITVDAAYKFDSAFAANSESHFAPVTKAYGGVEGRVVPDFNYKIPTPLGSHWLLSDANLVLGTNMEITPITVKPGIYAAFTPLPFLIFEGGAQIGTGWNIGSLYGTGLFSGFNPEEETFYSYNACNPFSAWLLKWYAQGTFQFDTGAIIKGDWTHVVMQYTYQIYYEGLTSANNQELWMWQSGPNKANGFQNYQSAILAYQMPLVLYRAGAMFEVEGHYKASDYNEYLYLGEGNGNFKVFSFSPLLQFNFGDNDNLTVLATFSSRRSFDTSYSNVNAEPFVPGFSGREWYFKRIAFRYVHKF